MTIQDAQEREQIEDFAASKKMKAMIQQDEGESVVTQHSVGMREYEARRQIFLHS